MGRQKIRVDRRILESMYLTQRLSQVKIGGILGCSFSTVKNRLIEYGIPFRNPAVARLRYEKPPFRGTDAEKAYMLGFAIGDLNVYKPSENGVTLVVRCHTTQEAQVRVFRRCFEDYGKITVSRAAGGIHITTYLDAGSFRFLLEKRHVPGWVDGKARWAFVAGYNDAEGNFILNQGRARMKIDSYDYSVLRWVQKLLRGAKIPCKFRRIGRAGDMHWQGYRFKKDLWRLNVNEARALLRLLRLLLPYTLHTQRKADMLKCLRNIKARAESGTI